MNDKSGSVKVYLKAGDRSKTSKLENLLPLEKWVLKADGLWTGVASRMAKGICYEPKPLAADGTVPPEAEPSASEPLPAAAGGAGSAVTAKTAAAPASTGKLAPPPGKGSTSTAKPGKPQTAATSGKVGVLVPAGSKGKVKDLKAALGKKK